MRRVDNLRVVIVQAVEQRFLDMSMDVRLGLLDHEEIGKSLFDLLIFKFEELEGQVNEVCSA